MREVSSVPMRKAARGRIPAALCAASAILLLAANPAQAQGKPLPRCFQVDGDQSVADQMGSAFLGVLRFTTTWWSGHCTLDGADAPTLPGGFPIPPPPVRQAPPAPTPHLP